MSDDAGDELKNFEELGRLRALVRRPRLLGSGNVLEFFIEKDSPDCDISLMLGTKRYHDAEVMLTIHLLKHPNGESARLPEKQPRTDGKAYAAQAHKLYERGFFRAEQVQKAIRGTKDRPPPPRGDQVQAHWALALSGELGYQSMGHVPLEVLRDWAERNEVVWLLPHEYREGGDGDEAS